MPNPVRFFYLYRNVTKNSEGVATNADEIAKLKKISNELDVRGQEDEKRVSELNVTVENLTMNVSMQHRTIIGLVEDRKLPRQFHYLICSPHFIRQIDPLIMLCMYADKELID